MRRRLLSIDRACGRFSWILLCFRLLFVVVFVLAFKDTIDKKGERRRRRWSQPSIPMQARKHQANIQTFKHSNIKHIKHQIEIIRSTISNYVTKFKVCNRKDRIKHETSQCNPPPADWNNPAIIFLYNQTHLSHPNTDTGTETDKETNFQVALLDRYQYRTISIQH